MVNFIYPVNDTSAVNIFKTPKDLVHQKLNMIIRQLLCANNVVEVGAHQMCHKVHLLEGLQRIIARMKNIQQANNVLVIHVLQHSQLTICAFGVHRRVEWTRQLLYGNFNVVYRINCRTGKQSAGVKGRSIV